MQISIEIHLPHLENPQLSWHIEMLKFVIEYPKIKYMNLIKYARRNMLAKVILSNSDSIWGYKKGRMKAFRTLLLS